MNFSSFWNRILSFFVGMCFRCDLIVQVAVILLFYFNKIFKIKSIEFCSQFDLKLFSPNLTQIYGSLLSGIPGPVSLLHFYFSFLSLSLIAIVPELLKFDSNLRMPSTPTPSLEGRTSWENSQGLPAPFRPHMGHLHAPALGKTPPNFSFCSLIENRIRAPELFRKAPELSNE